MMDGGINVLIDECDLEYDKRRIGRLEKLIKDFECRQIDAEDE